jgi:hypothetical protein
MCKYCPSVFEDEQRACRIPGGFINLRLRFEHLKRARHLDSCWFAQLEMGDQPLLADRCECLVPRVKLSAILMKTVSRPADNEFWKNGCSGLCFKSFQFLRIVTSLSPQDI